MLALGGPPYEASREEAEASIGRLCAALVAGSPLAAFPLIVVADDSEFASRTLANFLWVTFTRSNPADDVHGAGASIRAKHWSCRGPLVIDARIKPHHAPPLVEDPEVARRVDRLGAPGGPLHGII
jgi:4-hydroxy-3-polyprenylbenzoate decarboxylase